MPVTFEAINIVALTIAFLATLILVAFMVWLIERIKNGISPSFPVIGGIWNTVWQQTELIVIAQIGATIDDLYGALIATRNLLHSFWQGLEGLLNGLSNSASALQPIVNNLIQRVQNVEFWIDTNIWPRLASLEKRTSNIEFWIDTNIWPRLNTLELAVKNIASQIALQIEPQIHALQQRVGNIEFWIDTDIWPHLRNLQTELDNLAREFHLFISTQWRTLIDVALPNLQKQADASTQVAVAVAPLIAAGALTVLQADNLRKLADDPCYCINFGAGQDLSPMAIWLLTEME